MIFHCPHCGLKATPGRADCPGCNKPMARACPACAEQIAVTATACKYCGEDVAPLRTASAPKPDAGVRFLEEPVVSRACGWEDGSKGLLRRWWGTWAQSTFSPKAFFRGLKPDSGHRWPVGYAFGLTAQLLAVTVLAMVAGLGVFAANGRDPGLLARWSPAVLAIVGIPAVFVGMTAALYAVSLLWHVAAKVLGGKGGFQSTLRVVAYSSGATAWGLLPVVGALLAPLMGTVMAYHGFRELHGMGRFRAGLVALLPLLLAGGLVAAAVANGCFACCDPNIKYRGTF
jgi:hypothetical protein